MSKYVPDILSRRWVIISQARLSRPEDFHYKKKGKVCPFCHGNEHITPGELLRYGEGEKDGVGWKLRVIPNKYPITDYHEVIIHTPDCEKDIPDLLLEQVELIFKSYKERFNFYKKKGQVLIFCNQGEHAGASLTHSHSQLVVIPSQINLDSLSREPINNIVEETKYFIVYCPDFSQWPYEVWIAPKLPDTTYGDITDEEIADVSMLMQKILKRLKRIHKDYPISSIPFGYNYYIHPKDNWFIRIIPRFVYRAGFELGTGLSVNIIDPLDASLMLRGMEEKMAGVLKKLKKY